MKIPNKIRINGIDYAIESPKHLDNGERLLAGQVSYCESKIKIKATHEHQYRCVSLWHEILHAIAFSTGLELGENEEKIIDTLAYGINQVIQDNKESLFSLAENEVKEKLAVTKECQEKFIGFNLSWVMNNISKTIDMWLIPRIEEAKDHEDIRYCQGMLDAIGDLLEDNFYTEIQKRIYTKRAKLGTR